MVLYLSKISVMNNDDESFLSAYMDGELDPDQQQLRGVGARLRTLSSPRSCEA